MTMKQKASTREATPNAATGAGPDFESSAIIKEFAIDGSPLVNPTGIAIVKMRNIEFLKAERSKSGLVEIMPRCFIIYSPASVAHRFVKKVEIAAPSRPKAGNPYRPKIKKGSITALARAAEIIMIAGVWASPVARKAAFTTTGRQIKKMPKK